jgi:hypothetical protein
MVGVLSAREAAAYIGEGLNHFYTLVNAGEIAYILTGPQKATKKFRPADLDRYLLRNRVPDNAERNQRQRKSA